MKGLYYFVRKTYQFYQAKPIFERLGGEIITTTEFPITFFYFLLRYGPFRVRIVRRRKLSKIASIVRGLILCQNADNYVPRSERYLRVFIYHGTSDKTFTMPDKKLDLSWFEYYLLSGDKDYYKLNNFSRGSDRLKDKVIKIGMFRSDPIFKGDYDREKILKRYKIKPDGKKIILYAPTWKWGGGTLGICFEKFAKEIPKKYVLIIRPHANDRKNISYVSKWLKKNSNDNIYFFPRQYQDIMDFIYISDLMIGDHSAVNYDFALTLKPMVFVKSETEDVFIPPDEFNIKLCGPIYDPEKDDILERIEEAFNTPLYSERMKRLVQNSFYYNDGHAVDRACSFIIDKLSEMGIIKRDDVLRKLAKRFTYMNNYK